jgi:hypothetical protein
MIIDIKMVKELPFSQAIMANPKGGSDIIFF